VAAAVASMDRPVRLLLGGVFKGGDMAELAGKIAGKVLSIGLFGAAREVFEPVLAPLFPVSWDATLEAAVRRQFGLARKGDVILLSPGTASFDAYKGYAERGRDFARVARALLDTGAEAGR